MKAARARAVTAGWPGVDHQPSEFWPAFSQVRPVSMLCWISLRKDRSRERTVARNSTRVGAPTARVVKTKRVTSQRMGGLFTKLMVVVSCGAGLADRRALLSFFAKGPKGSRPPA